MERFLRLTAGAALCMVSALLNAQDAGFGLGFIVGEPTGISFKSWVSENRAVDGAAAWSLGRGSAFNLHVDYLFHANNAIHVSRGKMPIHYGPGVRLRVWSDGRYWRGGEWHSTNGNIDLAARFPVGLTYQFENAPLDAFIEAAPCIGILPETYFDAGGGLGLRYWF